MQKKQAKVFAGLLSMSLAVSLMTPLQGVSGQAARRKIALSKKSVTMIVGQKKTIRIKNAKGKRIKWSIKKKSIASYKKSGKYAVKLTAKKKGTTTLTCKVKNGKWKSYRCKVKVKKAALVRTPEATNDAAKITKNPSSTAVVTASSVPTETPKNGQDATQEPEKTPTATPTVKPTATPTATPTAAPVTTPTQKAQSTPAANNPTTPVVTDNPITPDNSSARTVIVKKLKFKYSSKKVKAGKKVKLSKWLKVTKNRAGDAKITYRFTKSKYNKYATLSKKGVFKAKKAGKKKTVYVKAAAGDGSKKTAKIKIKIK